MKTFRTNYKVAVNWLGNSFVMCNNMPEVDESIYENMRFNCSYLTDDDGNQYADYNEVPEDVEVYENNVDIYQWFITDCTESAVEYLEEHFGLLFTYSEKLDCYILCVDHWGTGWDYVMIDTDLENAAREEGESK